MRGSVAMALLAVTAACSSAKPPALSPQPSAIEQLASADRLVPAGCYDCLLGAYDKYDRLRSNPAVAADATLGAIRAAVLIAMRERELGMVDSGHLRIARDLAQAHPDLPDWLGKILEISDVLPSTIPGIARGVAGDIDLERSMALRRNAAVYEQILRDSAPLDLLAGYAYASFRCAAVNGRPVPPAEIFATLKPYEAAPLIAFRRATCRGTDGPAIERIAAADARFIEHNYLLGMLAVSRLPRPDLDGATALYLRAREWHPEWPSLTQALGNVAMTAEDFDGAIRFYGEALALAPRAVEARLGKVRALTYTGRHEEAIAEIDPWLEGRWNLGDAHYWRAVNEMQLQRNDEAWVDIEAAAKLLINADVPKLAGIIAYRRRQLDVARAKFEESRARSRDDCETTFYLGVVLAELRDWTQTADTLSSAGACLEAAEQRLVAEIDAIRASDEPPARKARQIARRERDITGGRRMRAQAWFNAAVAYFSLARAAEARQYAERLVDDEQFGARAKEILARLR